MNGRIGGDCTNMVDFREHIEAHTNLLKAYVDTICFISKRENLWGRLNWIIKKPAIDSTPYYDFSALIEVISLNFLITIFIESHMKSKLNQLSESYFQLAQTIPDYSDMTSYKKWLIQNGEYAQKFADKLISWKSIKGGIGILLPVVIGSLIPSLADLPNLDIKSFEGFSNSTLQFIMNSANPKASNTIITFFAIYVYAEIFVSAAFAYKRALFSPKIYSSSSASAAFGFVSAKEEKWHNRTIYDFEDNLFNLLSKNKKKEFPTDAFLWMILLIE